MDAKDDVCAMDVLLYILGEQRSQPAQPGDPKQKGLVSAIWSDYSHPRHPGIRDLLGWRRNPPSSRRHARPSWSKSPRCATPLVPDDEIQRAKMLLLGVYTMDNETYDGQAGTLGFYEAKDTYQFALEYEERSRA